MKRCDVLIVGGGFVGLTAALAVAQTLSKWGAQVTLLDANPQTQGYSADGRAIALAYTSVLLLKNLHIWPHIAQHAYPIQRVITSEQGRFNKLRIQADDLQIPYLGYVCPAPYLGSGLVAACAEQPLITHITGAVVTEIQPEKREVHYTHEGQTSVLQAQLILCCDGADSTLAQRLGYTVSERAYDQTAYVVNAHMVGKHEHTAYERFTAMGTLAVLPLPDQRVTVVLSLPHDKKEAWDKLSEDERQGQIQCLLGEHGMTLSDWGKAFEYPLKERVLNQTHQAGLLFLGNAVHTINPIAAQGLNLSFRDLSLLSDVLHEAKASGEDIGTGAVLARYEAKVKPAHQAMLRMTEFLVFVSKNKYSYVRSLGLGLLNASLGKGLLAKTLAGLSAHRGSLMERCDDV